MRPKILTIDDSKTFRMIIQRALHPYDCSICEASNGVEGLEVAAREKPDLIILDVTMPVMGGVEMLTALRQDPDLQDIPVIMLSAEDGREIVNHVDALGITNYLVKPFKNEQIIVKVRDILSLPIKPIVATVAEPFI
jgi:two-component system cell cycle response regulator